MEESAELLVQSKQPNHDESMADQSGNAMESKSIQNPVSASNETKSMDKCESGILKFKKKIKNKKGLWEKKDESTNKV